MPDSHALVLDTGTEARALQFARWSETSPARKFEMLQALCRDSRKLALAGIHQRHPTATPRERALRLGALTVERKLMIDAFGWNPERAGR